LISCWYFIRHSKSVLFAYETNSIATTDHEAFLKIDAEVGVEPH